MIMGETASIKRGGWAYRWIATLLGTMKYITMANGIIQCIAHRVEKRELMIYIETWEVDSPYGDRLLIAYSEEERRDGQFINYKRDAMEEEHLCRLIKLLRVDKIDYAEKIVDE